MTRLARQLQHAFVAHCPAGWECVPEARVVSAGIEAIFSYAPRADVLFRQAAIGRGIWVELEGWAPGNVTPMRGRKAVS